MLRCRSRKGAASFFMETIGKTCSCFGHSDVDLTDDLIVRTRIEIDKAVADGVRIFLFGGRSDFDDLCYDLVTEKRNDSQLNIKRCFVLHSISNSESRRDGLSEKSMKRWSVRQKTSIIGIRQFIIVTLQ